MCMSVHAYVCLLCVFTCVKQSVIIMIFELISLHWFVCILHSNSIRLYNVVRVCLSSGPAVCSAQQLDGNTYRCSEVCM